MLDPRVSFVKWSLGCPAYFVGLNNCWAMNCTRYCLGMRSDAPLEELCWIPKVIQSIVRNLSIYKQQILLVWLEPCKQCDWRRDWHGIGQVRAHSLTIGFYWFISINCSLIELLFFFWKALFWFWFFLFLFCCLSDWRHSWCFSGIWWCWSYPTFL